MQPDVQFAEGGAGKTPYLIRFADLTIHIPERQATLRGRMLSLTPTEFRLLTTLTRAPGHLFTYCDLGELVLGYTCAEREAKTILQVHINHLRRKLADDARSPRFIHCVRGVGYRWDGCL